MSQASLEYIFVQRVLCVMRQLNLSNISFEYAEGKTANAKSVISILASGVKCGDEITLIADGSDEEEALKTVSEKFKEALKD